MFKINYRIIINESYWKTLSVGQIEEEGGIEGFFQLDFGSIQYGYYHSEELKDGEMGFDIISTWLSNLIELCILIKEKKYVAIKDTETYNTWIEFILMDEKLNISLMQSDNFISDYIITSPLSSRTYPEWRDIRIDIKKVMKEVIKSTEQFIDELNRINSLFSSTDRIIQLQKLLNQIN